jgi:hypothetical protein
VNAAATAAELRIKFRREMLLLAALLVSSGEFISCGGAYHGRLDWQSQATVPPATATWRGGQPGGANPPPKPQEGAELLRHHESKFSW